MVSRLRKSDEALPRVLIQFSLHRSEGPFRTLIKTAQLLGRGGVLVFLCFSLVGSAFASRGLVEDTTRSTKLAEGYTLDEDSGQLYSFRVYADSTVSIRRERPASSDSALAIPATNLRLIYRRAKREVFSSGPAERVAVGYEDNNLVFEFTQRFNLYVFLALIVVIVVGGALLLWLWWRLARERRRRKEAARSRHFLAQGREKERKRLAKEIHDGPVQDLHGLHVTVKALSSDRTDEVADEITRVIGELRAMSADLHPPALDEFGLVAALRSHADRLSDRHGGLQVEMDVEGSEKSLPDDYALAVFRVAQEAMNNAVQHGEADHLRVWFSHADDTVVLEVRDNGDGFAPPDDWHALAEEDHFGLLGMRERAESIGAAIEINSTPGEGTRVRLHGTVRLALVENGRPAPASAQTA